jgi:hypothetical protein
MKFKYTYLCIFIGSDACIHPQFTLSDQCSLSFGLFVLFVACRAGRKDGADAVRRGGSRGVRAAAAGCRRRQECQGPCACDKCSPLRLSWPKNLAGTRSKLCWHFCSFVALVHHDLIHSSLMSSIDG